MPVPQPGVKVSGHKGDIASFEEASKVESSRNFQMSFVTTFEEADRSDRDYFWSLTPQQRWSLMETLRRRNYGNRASGRLLRVLEVAERPQR